MSELKKAQNRERQRRFCERNAHPCVCGVLINHESRYCKDCDRKLRHEASKRRDARTFFYRNVEKTLLQWVEELGLNYTKVRRRLAKGWDVKRAFETP